MDNDDNILERLSLVEEDIKNLKGTRISSSQRRNSIAPKFYFGSVNNYSKLLPIFIHVPKTAGRRFLSIFRKHINYFTHLPAYKIKEDVNEYEDIFSFAIIRNPYNRFISAFNYNKPSVSNINDFCLCFEKYKIEWAIDNKINHTEHFLPQTFFICKKRMYNKIIVKKLYKYENFQYMLGDLKERGVPNTEKFQINYNPRTNWQKLLNKESQEIIEREYKKDIELWESL